MAIAARTQTTGVSVKINLTITPAKYEANMAYNITLEQEHKLMKSAKRHLGLQTRLTEHSFVVDLSDAKIHASRKYTDQNMQIKKERCPRGRLMFTNGRYDRYVDFCVACIPKRIETATPRRHIASVCECDDTGKHGTSHQCHRKYKELFELRAREFRSQIVQKSIGL